MNTILHVGIVRNDLGHRHAIAHQAWLNKETNELTIAIHLQNKSNTTGFHAVSRVYFHNKKGDKIYYVDSNALGLNPNPSSRNHRNETLCYEVPAKYVKKTFSISLEGRSVKKGPDKVALFDVLDVILTVLKAITKEDDTEKRSWRNYYDDEMIP